MKSKMKSVLSLTMLFLLTLAVNAQINFEGSNDYGRINDITYDLTTENKVYGVSLGNHIVFSDDNGLNWEVLYSFSGGNSSSIRGLRNLGETSLSFYVQNSSSSSTNTVYIYDIASNEISKQYTPPVSTGATQEWVNAYSIYESDTDVVLFNQDFKIGTAVFSKVYYTSNGGDSWIEVYYNEDFDSVFPNNVAISPNNPQKLFMTRGNGPTSVDGGLLISLDAGTTWTEKIPGQILKAITFNPSDPDTVLIGTDSGSPTVQNIYQSEDGGDTWNTLPITWDSFSIKYINYIGYDPNNLDNIIVLESNEIAISSDGGLSWTNYIYADEPGSYFFGLNGSFNPFQSGEIMISTDYYPVISTDGGVTVSHLGNPMFHATKIGVSLEGDQHLYYSVQRGLVHKNLTTQEETPYYVEPINFVFSDAPPRYTIDSNIEGRIYMFTAGFTGQNLWVSNEHGSNISSINSTEFDTFFTVVTDPNDSNKVWVSYEFSGTKIIDFTDTSSIIYTPIALPAGNLHLSTFIDSLDSNNVLIGLGGEVYHTLDEGLTWENVSTGLNLDPQIDRIYDIQQNPYNSDEYLIATNQGVFKSEDGAQTWAQTYIGENTRGVKYSEIVEGHIVISIPTGEFNQAKIVYTTDNGSEWIDVPFESIEYTGSSSMDFVFHENSITAYIASWDLGAITYEIDTTTLGTVSFENNSNNLLIYPNPTSSIINIEFKDGELANKIIIYSYTGQKVLEENDLESINLENLNKGIYFVKVEGSNGGNYVKKIIKN